MHLDDLGYPGPRNDVADYLDRLGWRSTRTPLRQLLADAGLPVPAPAAGPDSIADNYYCSATR